MRWAPRHVVALGMVVLSVAAAVACSSPSPVEAPAPEPAAGTPHVHGAPPPPPAPLREGERFQEVGLGQAYQPTPPAGGTDDYRCFLIDPGLTEASYVTGTQFLPQNLDIVHHAIVYSVPPSGVAAARAKDAGVAGDGWQCFGGTGLNNGFGGLPMDTYLGGWAPGGKEMLLAGVSGYPVEAGTLLVLQVHYNLLYTNGKPGPLDQSTVRLRLMPGTAEVTPLKAVRILAPIELPCTTEESGPLCDREAALDDLVKRTGPQARATVSVLNSLCNRGAAPVAGPNQACSIRVREPALVYSAAPHMHLLGKSILVELNPGTPEARTLLDQKAFNFDDQSMVPLPEPVRINAGDILRLTCTHDASLRSKLPELKPLQPRYVVWGDGTSDEMCLATLVTTAV